jgi:4-amino-4-deoxy-L-arabinose transferase-like glycosyltransferase
MVSGLSKWDWRRPPAVLVALAAMLAALAINHAGYRGGGADDWHYLEAARCGAAQHGFCVPSSHWWARFPLVAPMAVALGLGGESRLIVGIVPLFYAALALALFTLLVERRFGRAEAIVAGVLMATLPTVSLVLLQPNVDTAELAFTLAGLLMFESAFRNGRGRDALAGGALLGLAILTRPSALALLPIAALVAAATPSLRRFALPAALGVAAPLAAEAIVYWLWLGEPLHSWALSLGHTRIPSAELPPDFHSARGPLFNPDYVAAWRPAMGIRVHWTIDPMLNLLANPAMGPLLIAALLLVALRRPSPRDAPGRALLWLLGAAVLYFGAITYAFAIDPKPRMFLPVAAAAAAIFAVLAVRMWRDGSRALIGAIGAVTIGTGLVYAAYVPDLSGLETPAGSWVREFGPALAVDDASGRFLTLVPDVRALPIDPPSASRYMIVALGPCEEVPRFRTGWRVERTFALTTAGGEQASLCLFRRAEGPAAMPPR